MIENSEISFHIEDIPFELKEPELLISWLKEIASESSFSIGEMNYVFCSDEYVLALNKEHLDHDYYTDILTFPYQANPIMSDIYISIDRVRDNAHSLKQDFERELHRVMAHGLLHLLGYDDHGEEAIVAMRKAEEGALKKLDDKKK
ncbi:MAG: rRNA maturation RNase YbeY [Bacteroidia bacterium]